MQLVYRNVHRNTHFSTDDPWTMVRYLIRQGYPGMTVTVWDRGQCISRLTLDQLKEIEAHSH